MMKMRYLIAPIFLAVVLPFVSGCNEEENGNQVDMSKLPGKWSILTSVFDLNFLGTPTSETETYPYNFNTFEFDGAGEVLVIVVEEGVWATDMYAVDGNTLTFSEETFGFEVTFTITKLTDSEFQGFTEFADVGISGRIELNGIRNDGRETTITTGDLVGSWNITQFDTYKNDTLQTPDPDDPQDITFQNDGSGFLGDAATGTLISYGLIDGSNIGLRTDTNDDGLLTDEEDELWHVLGLNSNNLGLVSYEIDDTTDPATTYRYEVTLLKN